MTLKDEQQARRALVVGATGIVGSAITQRLLDDGWQVAAASRSGAAAAAGAAPVKVDLLDPTATRLALQGIPATTHLFYAAYLPAPSRAQEVAPNLAMLKNVVAAAGGQGQLKRVVLVTGAKFYGIQWGASPTPMREQDARQLGPNFYYDQEDFLREASVEGGWSWCNLIPPFVIGMARGNPMNLVTAVGVYAALCKAQGLPLRFPGSLAAYDALHHVADTRQIASAAAWAAEAPQAANEAFNVANDDPTRWRSLWPAIATHLGMTVGEPKALPLPAVMAANEAAWRHGARLASLVDWTWADYMLRMQDDVVLATGKLRRAGFTACMETEAAWFERLDELATLGMVPAWHRPLQEKHEEGKV